MSNTYLVIMLNCAFTVIIIINIGIQSFLIQENIDLIHKKLDKLIELEQNKTIIDEMIELKKVSK